MGLHIPLVSPIVLYQTNVCVLIFGIENKLKNKVIGLEIHCSQMIDLTTCTCTYFISSTQCVCVMREGCILKTLSDKNNY
jgi:hypothetical protein